MRDSSSLRLKDRLRLILDFREPSVGLNFDKISISNLFFNVEPTTLRFVDSLLVEQLWLSMM
jgi:hypothetical protein